MSLKDFKENCRLCLVALAVDSRSLITEETEKICNIEVNREIKVQHNCESYKIKFFQLFQNSSFSSFICQQCSTKLKEIKEFKTQIRDNQEFLRGLIEHESLDQELTTVEDDRFLKITEKKVKKRKREDFPE